MSFKEGGGEMPDDDEKNQGNSEEDKGSRMDAAKAFFRAMYAGEEPPQAEPKAQASSAGDSRRVAELEHQVKEAENRATEAENLYKRMAADFENFRRRMEREKEEFTNVGVRKAAEAIIPALDDLDRALMYLSADTPADKLIESFQLVAGRINQCLEQAGLKRLQTKGGVLFDPRYHEPVQQIETEEHPDQTIMHELRGGYILGDKVIRPALVNVALNNSVPITPMPELNENKSTAESVAAEKAVEPKAVATAEPEEKEETQAKEAKSSAQPDDGSRVYDLGDLEV